MCFYHNPLVVTTRSPPHKRSTCLRNKKARALGIEIDYRTDQNILFINSLTTGDIAKLGVKCGVKFPSHAMEGTISKLQSMEQAHCKKPLEGVALA